MSTRKDTAALLTNADQGEDIPNKNMNESSAQAERKPDWSPDHRQHSLIRHIQTQSEKKWLSGSFDTDHTISIFVIKMYPKLITFPLPCS